MATALVADRFAGTPVSAPLGPTLARAEFEFIRHVIGKNAGIVLGPNKRELVERRLAARLRELALPSYAAYCDHLRASGPEELAGLINALTTNVTAFFREQHHFEALAEYMIPEAMQRNQQSRRLRIWSAGCSSGEEAYSLAMVAAEIVPPTLRWDLKILGTDIDSEVVATAQRGIYPIEGLTAVPEQRLRSCFRRGTGEYAGSAKVNAEITRLITFRPLNLLEPWPMHGPFDIIFCRNVMIYFDRSTRERIVGRCSALLADGGYLCLGHSEVIHDTAASLQLVGNTIYRKESKAGQMPPSHPSPVNGGRGVG